MDSKPKIIQVTPFFQPHLGGMENHVAEISKRLVQKNYSLSIYTSNIGYSKELQVKHNYEVHYLKSVEFAHTPIIFSLFLRLLFLPSNSIFHTHVSLAYTPEIVFLVSKIRRIPYIAHIHLDVNPSGFFGFLLEPYKKIFLKKFLKSASKIICLSEDQKIYIAKKYDLSLDKIAVIPNGVGEEFFTKNKFKNKIPHLLFVGRITIQKNPILLINSIALCESKFILDIVGEGELLEKIKKIVIQKKIKNVIFHGRKNGEDLISLYHKANAFISTSNNEAFPLTILEAMASELPIIASDVDGNHELVNKVGILVNPPEPSNFAKEIDKLFNNEKFSNELSKKSLQFAKKHTWSKVIKKIQKVYSEVQK